MPFTGEQEPTCVAALQRRLQATAAAAAETRGVLEATGNYWVALAVTLHEAGYRIAVVNPRQARHCAKAQRRRAKTDALDARDLARLAAALIQATVADEYRGRIFGAIGALGALSMLVGTALAGTLGDRLGVVTLLNVEGALFVAAGFVVLTLVTSATTADITDRARPATEASL